MLGVMKKGIGRNMTPLENEILTTSRISMSTILNATYVKTTLPVRGEKEAKRQGGKY